MHVNFCTFLGLGGGNQSCNGSFFPAAQISKLFLEQSRAYKNPLEERIFYVRATGFCKWTYKTVEELEHIRVKKTELLSPRITYIFLYEELGWVFLLKKVDNSRNTPAPLLIRLTLSGNTTTTSLVFGS